MSTPRQVTPRAAVLVAPNPGPMTLEGTNTYLLRAPGAEGCVVVDPGPRHEGHLAAVAAAGPVVLILLTHGHADHADGARRLHELTGAAVRALDRAHRLGEEGVGEGDVVAAAGVEVDVLATPGHSADSLSFHLREDDAVLTGDTVLGRGTTVVAHPDGRLADYLASLQRLRALGDATVLPGHGPELASAGVVAQEYLDHRTERLEQVRAALAAGDGSPYEVVRRVYADVDPVLWPAAELSVRAQLDFLRERPAG
ncbi:MAG TPA: MBL fold metallo-hydrolase [Frankiaceae bacterium]|nr:MBL fold metallo-hydrolase [Frankiaceae bacterium]